MTTTSIAETKIRSARKQRYERQEIEHQRSQTIWSKVDTLYVPVQGTARILHGPKIYIRTMKTCYSRVWIRRPLYTRPKRHRGLACGVVKVNATRFSLDDELAIHQIFQPHIDVAGLFSNLKLGNEHQPVVRLRHATPAHEDVSGGQ